LALFTKKERLLGIDISPSAVKLVELNRTGQKIRVEGMAIEPLPEGSMEDRNPTDLDEVGSAIKRALKTSGSRLKKAAVAVPTSSIITRTIPMPVEFGEEDIEANIQVEASQYIPFPLEEIYVDFQIQGLSQADAATQDVVIVASRKENVDLRRDALRDAGLTVAVVDVEAYALENTFRLLGNGAANPQALAKPTDNTGKASMHTAIIDIGANITTLYILQDDRVIFTREQSFGADQLTREIARAYEIPKERAELAKRSGELPEDYAVNLLAPFKQSAAEQVAQALQFFFSSSPYNSVENIVLVGGGSMVADLAEAIANQTGVATVIGNPFEQMSNAPRINRHSLLRDAPLFAVACGLALRSFD